MPAQIPKPLQARYPASAYRRCDYRRRGILLRQLMAAPRDVSARVELERLRVLALYETVPPNRLALAAGLIEQAARLRVQLDDLAEDLALNGMTELFQQSEKQEPYDRERPACAIFAKLDKNYQGIMARLDSMLPPQPEPPKPDPAADKLAAFVNDG